ncbi:MAG: hypothetical protein TU35_007455 [Thermoproteus sp. AZ2]|uniref:Uncharacterized protein n=1 Tax=Thermoproteus sp. AZ2 TaxID=1609232 RepID=A0ACC6V287_9CREN
MIFERYKAEVEAAKRIISSGGFAVVTHGGTAHADDTIASALLYAAGAEAVYRLTQPEELLEVAARHKRVIYVDIGYKWYGALKAAGEVAVLDHHAPNGEPEYVELPSSLLQTAEALGLRPRPRASLLLTAADLVDRFGPSAKRWLGVYGSSLNYGLASYFGQEKGEVKDLKYLKAIVEALASDFDVQSFDEYSKAYASVSLPVDPEKYPRALALARLMKLASSGNVLAVAISPDAFKSGFGVDFAAHAVLANKALAEYVGKGLEKYFEESLKAIRLAESGRYTVVHGPVKAIAVEESVPPAALWNALLDLGALKEEEPAIIAVKDNRNQGAYTVWRPERHKDKIDFRRLEGGDVVFKHQSGFMAVLRAPSAEDAARAALERIK